MQQIEDLRDNDLQILDTFPDLESSYAFQGLKRKLGMHQETLSRALHRLEQEELIEHTLDGYRLTPRGSAVLKRKCGNSATSYTILDTYLPSKASPSELVSGLKSSWFGAFRWLGYRETRAGPVLTWMTEDGDLQIRARFHENRLLIETDAENGNIPQTTIKFAYELISRITKESTVWNN